MTKQQKKQSTTPTHDVFHVSGDENNARWMKIGVGWAHKDDDGMNLAINYSPLIEGRTVIRKTQPKQEADVAE